MRKFCSLTLLFLLIFTSCDEDYDDGFFTIEVRVTTEDNVAPNGNVYIFYLGKDVDVPKKTEIGLEYELYGRYTPFITFSVWNNEKNVIFYPVSEYGTEKDGMIHQYRDKGFSYAMFYVDKLSMEYGNPQNGGIFLVLVMPYKKWEAPAFMLFSINKNATITTTYTNTQTEDLMYVKWNIQGGVMLNYEIEFEQYVELKR